MPFEIETIDLGALGRPQTKIMMNVGTPDEAFALAAIPCDGVGLAREEFIITTYVKVHPQVLLEFDSLDNQTKAEINSLSMSYTDKPQFYIDRLAEGIAMIAAAFHPKDVILKTQRF